MRCLLIAAIALAVGCSAEFTDLRPEGQSSNNATTGSNQSTSNNAASSADAGMNNMTSPDAGTGTDAGNMNPGSETLIASGDFVNVDYQTAGTAQYWQLADGTYEVRLSMDFSTQGVPGPALALSPRNPLGGSIESDELDIGALDSNSGMQSYSLPGPPTDYTHAWIWCKPFGLDVAFAEMEFQ